MHILGVLLFVVGFSLSQQENPFRIERTIADHAKTNGEKITVNYTVYKDGDTIYAHNKSVDYDIPVPELAVFSTGQSVMVNSFDGTLTFFNVQGQAEKETQILKGLVVKYERSIKLAVDGAHLVLTLSDPGLKEVLLQIYNSDGQILKQWKIEEEFVNGLSYSEKAGAMAVSVFEWKGDKLVKSVLFYNDRGELLSSKPANFTKGVFINDAQIFAGQTNKECFLYNLATSKTIFNYNVADGEMIIGTNYSDPIFNLVTTKTPRLEEGKWYYDNPSIKQFNNHGELLKSWTENVPSFSTFGFEQDGSQLLFVMDAKAITIK
jgi:outer membrane protein assembly factor BamB